MSEQDSRLVHVKLQHVPETCSIYYRNVFSLTGWLTEVERVTNTNIYKSLASELLGKVFVFQNQRPVARKAQCSKVTSLFPSTGVRAAAFSGRPSRTAGEVRELHPREPTPPSGNRPKYSQADRGAKQCPAPFENAEFPRQLPRAGGIHKTNATYSLTLEDDLCGGRFSRRWNPT